MDATAGDAGERRRLPQRLSHGLRRNTWWVVVGTFAVLTVLIGLFSIHMVRAAGERRQAEQWHIHTLEVLLVAEQFRISTYDVLRGERGYLLTADPTFLEPYHAGRANADRLLNRLRALVSDNPAQTLNVEQVRRQLQVYLRLIDRTVRLKQQGRSEAALAVVRGGHGRREFSDLQDRIQAVETFERSLLIERRLALDATNAFNDRMGYAAAALIVLLLAIAVVAALSAIRAQRRAALAAEELRRLATVDELTGLPNRRHFAARLEEELARARRGGSPLCLAMLDIDHFKRINDQHGHPAGDAVLRQLAVIVREKIRLGDSAARLGGEEFALLLPNTNAHQARLVCDRLRAAVAARLFEIPEGGALRVTLSTGVALLHAEDDMASLMRRSDEALYHAKQSGRNQVRLAA